MNMTCELHNKDAVDKDAFSNLYKIYEQSEKKIHKNDDLEI